MLGFRADRSTLENLLHGEQLMRECNHGSILQLQNWWQDPTTYYAFESKAGARWFAEHGGPCLVLDFGTAVTWEVVSENGEYLGGAIAPGPGVTAEALSLKTAKLPSVAMEPPDRVIGKGTVDSIQSGLFYGYLGLIEGVTRRILDELGEATVVATGGLAGAFASQTDLIHHVEPDLTLHGLRILWQLNREGVE